MTAGWSALGGSRPETLMIPAEAVAYRGRLKGGARGTLSGGGR